MPDNAVREIGPDDVRNYAVVRIADEITIDLLGKACEVIYATAGIEYFEFKKVRIPIADITTMIETKQGIRPRDKEDLAFLKSRLEE